jgi:hypothetical protein
MVEILIKLNLGGCVLNKNRENFKFSPTFFL